MRTIVFVSSVVAIASILACSSSPKNSVPTSPPPTPAGTTDPNTPNDAPTSTATSTTSNPPPVNDAGTPPPPENQASCLAACSTQYPKAAAENNSLDSSCFLGGSCAAVCNDLPASGKEFEPNVVADADAGITVCDTATANSYPIDTPSQDCSNCLATNTTCCTLWISIFGSADGQALNACSINCFEKYPN
jgi:hypothetical protein